MGSQVQTPLWTGLIGRLRGTLVTAKTQGKVGKSPKREGVGAVGNEREGAVFSSPHFLATPSNDIMRPL